MQISEIRKLFIDYFVKNGHTHEESSSLIPHNDDTLLFTNSGMVQFKNIFLGQQKSSYKTAVTVQKCLRAGGKHNDLDNVGYTARHHTFFEMLGNFSFGDYFKEKAIFYAWDFLTNHLKIDKNKLLVTVYHTDDEAYELWQKIANLPSEKIIRISSKDNFWEMGEFGPCGPCTEIFYDHGDHIEGGVPGSANEDGDRYIEIWNIVFMQYEKLPDGTMINLKHPCIDTGMGLERIASILQGVSDNYDTDLFANIIKSCSDLTKIQVTKDNKVAFKVIADHIRAAAFLISDGIVPSNEGRGYILRRILRRAIRYAYMLGYKNDPILCKVFLTLKTEMGQYYKDLLIRDEAIFKTIQHEEIKFHETFESGMKILHQEMKGLKSGDIFSGELAFKLYETYGFPVDLTDMILKDSNIKIDYEAFEKAKKHHQDLAKNSWSGSGEVKEDKIWFSLKETIPSTEFIGYDLLISKANIQAIVKNNNGKLNIANTISEGDKGYIVIDKTPFYAEMGGQLGDIGYLVVRSNEDLHFIAEVLDTQKMAEDIFVHKVYIKQGSITVGDEITAEVDKQHRRFLSIHHTAVHLLGCALRMRLGSHIVQQGSLVAQNRLRFDVSHPHAISKEDIVAVEDIVNYMIGKSLDVVIQHMPLTDALSQGVIAMATEKYPDYPRTVKIEDNDNESGYITKLISFELCGGTHVDNTSKLGLFTIVSEGSVASGIRRIEAVCSSKLLNYYKNKEANLHEVINALGGDEATILEKAKNLLTETKELRKNNSYLLNRLNFLLLKDKIEIINNKQLLIAEVNDISSKDLKTLAVDMANNHINNGLIFLYVTATDKRINFVVIYTGEMKKKATKEYQQKVLKTLEGTGGGSPSLYQGVGVSNKLTTVKDILNAELKSNN